MLIRVTGARDGGVAAYLRHGMKQGREFTRDELDERVTLAGDLDLTDSIIQGMTNSGDRYLHVTLAFKEDSISPDVLQAITDEFRSFTGAAYEADEFNFYAEAHLPRIKHYTNKATGDHVERKPHIHIVIPQKNLITGTTCNPFGTGDKSNDFLKAFQERVNAKYGLASPDDHQRDTFNNESAMLARYKGDEFAGAHRGIKEQIRDDVLSRRIESPEAFRAYLKERWEVSTVKNNGRICYAIKPEGSSRRVRLTESFFAAESITRPTAEKLALQKQQAAAYIAAQPTRQVQEQHREREAYWHAVKAKEIKYLNSGRRGEWQRYKAADADTRAAMLAEKERAFYARHKTELTDDHDAITRNATRHIDANLRAASRHIDAAGRVDRHDELARRKLHDRRIARATRAIVHGRGRDQEAHGERRPVKRSDTPAGTHLAKLEDAQQQRRAGRGAMDEIKQRLDGERLLRHLSHTHGVDPAKYQVLRTERGDRIQCGSKSYNVTDFCTKEMHLPFADAAPVLRECYADQKRARGIEAKPRPREALWQDYSTRWRVEQRAIRAQATADHKARLRAEKSALIDRFRRERANITATRGMTKAEKAAARSVVRVRQVEAEAALKEQHHHARAALAEQHPARPTFNDYLHDRASQGSVDALNELRRQSRPVHRAPEANAVAIEAKRAGDASAFSEQLAYRVSRAGDVTYYDLKGDVLRDEAQRVQAFRTDDATLATALRVAERKFYEPGQKGATTIELAGSAAQIRSAIEVAAKEHINVKFADPAHEAMRRDLQEQYRVGRAFIAEQKRTADRKKQPGRPKSSPEHQRQGPAQDTTPRPAQGRDDRGMGR